MKAKRKPRIFHGLVNYGTQAGLIARELRKCGYQAISVTYPDPYKRVTDIQLKHGGNIIQKILRHSWNYYTLIKYFFKYDIFHFYYGTSLLPHQRDLPLYKYFGKKIIMEYLGNDLQGYRISVDKYKWTNVSYMMTEEEGIKYDISIKKRRNNETKYVNKTLVCAPYLSEFDDKSLVLPLALDLERFNFFPLPDYNGTFRIMHAPTHRGFKGTKFISEAIETLKSEGYSILFDLVENVKHDELLDRYKMCHIFIDQIIGGWYGTASIEAMAIGRPVIVSIRDEYKQHIDYGDRIPAIHADPDCIYEVLKNTLSNGYEYLDSKGRESRKFVEEIHCASNVTKELIQIYSSI